MVLKRKVEIWRRELRFQLGEIGLERKGESDEDRGAFLTGVRFGDVCVCACGGTSPVATGNLHKLHNFGGLAVYFVVYSEMYSEVYLVVVGFTSLTWAEARWEFQGSLCPGLLGLG